MRNYSSAYRTRLPVPKKEERRGKAIQRKRVNEQRAERKETNTGGD